MGGVVEGRDDHPIGRLQDGRQDEPGVYRHSPADRSSSKGVHLKINDEGKARLAGIFQPKHRFRPAVEGVVQIDDVEPFQLAMQLRDEGAVAESDPRFEAVDLERIGRKFFDGAVGRAKDFDLVAPSG
jgi:hypothetical protein